MFFHAHPDDEVILTGGTMALAADRGHRVVVVFGTDGDLGLTVPGHAETPEALASWRRAEAERAAEILGVSRVEFLGYGDSGMEGEDTNAAPGAFAVADVEEAAGRVAAVLEEEDADVFVIYDDHGNYHHPDHVAVYTVGTRAAQMAGTQSVLWATVNRDAMRRQFEEAKAAGLLDDPDGPAGEAGPDDRMGMAEADLTHAVDVTSVVETKRAAMRAHSSQIADDSWFLALPEEIFARAFGTEWYADPVNPRAAGASLLNSVV